MITALVYILLVEYTPVSPVIQSNPGEGLVVVGNCVVCLHCVDSKQCLVVTERHCLTFMSHCHEQGHAEVNNLKQDGDNNTGIKRFTRRLGVK